jgi:putative flippase GtrA
MPVINKFYNLFHGYFRNKFPKCYCFCAAKKSFLKFFVAGSLAGLTDLIFLFLFHGVFDLDIVLATSLAFLISFAVSFSLQRQWTFRNHDEKKVPKQLVLYFLNAFLSLNINGLGMHLLVNGWSVTYLLAQIIVNLALGGLNFVIYKTIVFRNDNEQEDETNCEQEQTA